MTNGGPDNGRPYFGPARTVGGLALLFAAIILSLADVVSDKYEVDSIVLGLLLGTGVVLLGVEAGARLLDRGR